MKATKTLSITAEVKTRKEAELFFAALEDSLTRLDEIVAVQEGGVEMGLKFSDVPPKKLAYEGTGVGGAAETFAAMPVGTLINFYSARKVEVPVDYFERVENGWERMLGGVLSFTTTFPYPDETLELLEEVKD